MNDENMKLRFLNGARQGEIVDIGDGVSIGRDPSCDVTLDEDGVSRDHCRIYYAGGIWFVEDLGSTNGVRVNGELIEEKKTLHPGDRIGVHHRLFLFISENQLADPKQLAEYEAIAHGAAQEESTAEHAAPSGPVETQLGDEKQSSKWKYFAGAAAAIVLALLLIGILASTDKTETGGGKQAVEDQEEERSGDENGSEEDLGYGLDTEEEEGMRFSEEMPSEVEPDESGQASELPFSALIRSAPQGAQVKIDGEKQGKTPFVLRDLDEGRHRLELSLAGYESVSRVIRIPEKVPAQKFELRKKPGTVFFHSEPEGATVKEKGQILGETPFCKSDLSEGEHEVSFLLYGYEKKKKSFQVDPSKVINVKAELASKLATLKILTMPPYCRISVGGIYQGTTRPQQDENHNRSQILQVRNLRPGVAAVRAVHPLGAEKKKKVRLQPGDSELVLLKMWVRDVRVELQNGDTISGLFLYKDDAGKIALRTEAGEQREYTKEEIAQVHYLGPAAEKSASATEGATGNNAEHTEPSTTDLSSAKEVKKETVADAEKEKQETASEQKKGSGGGTSEPEPPSESRSVQEVLTVLENQSIKELRNRMEGNELVVHGVPKRVQNTGIRTVITLHEEMKGEMSIAAYNAKKEKLNNAIEEETTVSMRGEPVMEEGVLWLRRAEIVSVK